MYAACLEKSCRAPARVCRRIADVGFAGAPAVWRQQSARPAAAAAADRLVRQSPTCLLRVPSAPDSRARRASPVTSACLVADVRALCTGHVGAFHGDQPPPLESPARTRSKSMSTSQVSLAAANSTSRNTDARRNTSGEGRVEAAVVTACVPLAFLGLLLTLRFALALRRVVDGGRLDSACRGA